MDDHSKPPEGYEVWQADLGPNGWRSRVSRPTTTYEGAVEQAWSDAHRQRAIGAIRERDRILDIICAHLGPLPADDPSRRILADIATDIVLPEDPS